MQENFGHYSVLLNETVDSLNIKPDGVYVDCTLGGAGHSNLIASRLSEKGRLIGIDRDEYALGKAKERLAKYGDRIMLVHTNFVDGAEVLKSHGIDRIDGVVADLGVSSFQLDDATRGFSYMQDAPLDMRMDRSEEMTAYDVVNTYSERELAKIIDMYGEERYASSIARKIVKYREEKLIETTLELSEIIKSGIPAKNKQDGPHPAKRTFQAIRIEVNGELNIISDTINNFFPMLSPGGRMAIITFHSLEDRIVKHTFLEKTVGCTCPPDFPVCVCGKKAEGRVITKKPILPSQQELDENPRSRSAKLRVLEKI
ncbi:MAG: 16S rRNA (cytosine(1402)-N(4))-methyltransferase RsmH [Ruminococcaceae bacterium]|nr:16S rRNA (cytosine(1402)-N(4))-methyltransferase RsmH [Oscillospiraceae bacterium]